MNQVTITIQSIGKPVTFYKNNGEFLVTFTDKSFSAKDFKRIKTSVQKELPKANGFDYSIFPMAQDFLEVQITFLA